MFHREKFGRSPRATPIPPTRAIHPPASPVTSPNSPPHPTASHAISPPNKPHKTASPKPASPPPTTPPLLDTNVEPEHPMENDEDAFMQWMQDTDDPLLERIRKSTAKRQRKTHPPPSNSKRDAIKQRMQARTTEEGEKESRQDWFEHLFAESPLDIST